VVQERLLTLDEVTAYLAVPLSVVEELVASRALRILRIGPERRIAPEDLAAFLKNSAK
jgi:excisionase family DNA binding protein